MVCTEGDEKNRRKIGYALGLHKTLFSPIFVKMWYGISVQRIYLTAVTYIIRGRVHIAFFLCKSS